MDCLFIGKALGEILLRQVYFSRPNELRRINRKCRLSPSLPTREGHSRATANTPRVTTLVHGTLVDRLC